MEPENLDYEAITDARRKAIEQTIEPIGIDELKSLGEKLFPFLDHPWRQTFLEFVEEHASDSCLMTPRHMIRWRSFTVLQKKKACGSRGVEAWVHCRPGELGF